MKKSISLYEYDSTPLEELFSKDEIDYLDKLSGRLIPNKKVFDVTRTHIRPNSIVGSFSVGNKHIEILPKLLKHGSSDSKKTIVQNLMHMLSYTHKIEAYDASIANLDSYNDSFLEAYIRIFSVRLLKLLTKQIPRRYIKREENLNYVKGKIYFKEHLKSNYANQAKIYCIYDDFSHDNLISQTFKFVCKQLIHKTSNIDTYKKLKKSLNLLCEVSDRHITNIDVSTIQISRANSEFLYVFNLAKMFLSHMSSTSSNGKNEVSSILFDMNELFEEYVYQLIRRNSDYLGINKVHLQKGRRLVQAIRPFGENWKKGSQFNTHTDIFIEFKNGKNLIIDTKYKLLDTDKPHWNIKNADVYQILTYKLLHSKGNDFPETALLYPQNKEQLGQEFKLSNMNHSFYAFTICLSNNLKLNEFRIINELNSIFKNQFQDLHLKYYDTKENF